MALLDAGPIESPPGMAVATGALLTVLMETLISEGVLNKYQIHRVVTGAQTNIANLADSPAFNDAKLILKNLLDRFPAQ
jgi:hypothetical protein